MGRVAIVSACYGAYDTICSQASQDIAVDWIYVTDGPAGPAPWTTITRPSGDAPRLAAKRVKCQPWLLVDHPDVIWIDANTQVTSPAFAREALACRHDGIALFAHPRRDCIYTEAQASLGAESQGGKYAGEPIAEQTDHYRAQGHPEHGGLFACGTIAWDASDPGARALGAAWIAECEQWSIQDQLSLPVIARRLGVTPGVFPFAQIRRGYLANKWLRLHPHA